MRKGVRCQTVLNMNPALVKMIISKGKLRRKLSAQVPHDLMINQSSSSTRLQTESEKQKTILHRDNLDYTKIKETIRLTTMHTEPNSKEEIQQKERVEEIFRSELMNLIRHIERLCEIREGYQNDILNYQKEIKKLKDSIKKMNDNLMMFRTACEKHRSKGLYQKFVVEREHNLKKTHEINKKIKSIENSISGRMTLVKRVTTDIKSLKGVKDKRILSLIKYYCSLIAMGTDIRNEGLSWILYKLLELGFDINRCQYPPYITKKNFEYLINVSRLKIDIEKFKILYHAIRAKFSKNQNKRKNPNELPLVGESHGTFYEKFLQNYLKDKNTLIHINLRDPDTDARFKDFLDDEAFEHHLKNSEDETITKEIIEDVSEIKKCYEKCHSDLAVLQKDFMKKFKEENEDLRLFNFKQYKLIFQSLFGLTTVVS